MDIINNTFDPKKAVPNMSKKELLDGMKQLKELFDAMVKAGFKELTAAVIIGEMLRPK